MLRCLFLVASILEAPAWAGLQETHIYQSEITLSRRGDEPTSPTTKSSQATTNPVKVDHRAARAPAAGANHAAAPLWERLLRLWRLLRLNVRVALLLLMLLFRGLR